MKKSQPGFLEAFAEGVAQALAVFTGEKTPPKAARDLMKGLEAAVKKPPRRPR